MFKRKPGASGDAENAISSVNPVEAQKRLMNAQEPAVLIDVREPWEYARGHAKGAKNIPLSQLNERAAEAPTDRETLVICQSGHRSMQAAKALRQRGLTRVTNVTGGTTVWQMSRLPME